MSAIFNRGTGLLIIEVRRSNPNGDPDAEGEPRTIGPDRRGLISPVSFKRKLRDIVAEKNGPVWMKACSVLDLDSGANANDYDILEMRDRNRKDIWAMNQATFTRSFWDARLLGNTFLEKKPKDAEEKTKETKKKPQDDKSHFINTGTVQFGPGISVAPIDIKAETLTNKAGVEGDKDRGMAPLAWRFVDHAIYTMPFFVNPLVAAKSGCTGTDIDLMKLVIPLAYLATASVARPHVEILYAWYAEHQSPLGSCPDWRIIDAMTPTKRADVDKPSRSREEYHIPTADDLPDSVRTRLSSFEDLMLKDWSAPA